MISNQILQNTIDGLKGIARVDFCVLDTEGKELAATFDSPQDRSDAVLSFVESPADSQVIQGCQFFKIFDEQRLEYVLLADGDTEDVYMLGKIAAFQIQSLLVAYKERFDKDNFIKNLLLDNLLLVDIYNRAKKLHIDTEVKRVIFIIETSHERDNAALENVRGLLEQGVDPAKMITCREDVYRYLVALGMGAEDAANWMERVYRGHIQHNGFTPADTALLESYGAEPWFIQACSLTNYLWPESHSTIHCALLVRLVWYILHFPQLEDQIVTNCSEDDFSQL